MNFSDYFELDANSPTGLVWKKDILAYNGKMTQYKAGMIAGGSSGHKDNRLNVMLFGKTYKCARIVMELFTGTPLPDGAIVDHKDGNPLNNDISNLRVATQLVNMRNTRKYRNNTSGVTGVKFWVNHFGTTFARAAWRTDEGKNCTKSFSVTQYGLLPAFSMAVEFRRKMVEELNEQGANYSERHGK